MVQQQEIFLAEGASRLHLRREWHGGVEHSEVLSSAEVCGLISVFQVLREAFKVVSEAFKGSYNALERDMQVQLK